MNLADLRAVQADERGTDSLQSLPDSFYRDVADYIEGLRADRERAAANADNPFDSDEVRRLTDEIEAAEEVIEAVYERRVGKLVKQASLAAAGMPTDEAGMTDEERELFSDLVDRIEANRRTVLAAFDGERGADPGQAADTGPGADAPASPMDASDAMGATPPSSDPEPGREGRIEPDEGDEGDVDVPPEGGRARPEAAASASGEAADREPRADPGSRDADRVTLRITRDVGEVFGVDERTYELDEEDVVTLPEANAKPLLERDAAQRLD